ncbi:MAG TPA: enoyl-CoA hydratase/isomerase family protein [Thermoanaerobaculia bacterium]|nr:enoyl-CoA hydratase/isomerase family protein [Thermoanaerobaculia bacterium]
MTETKVRFEESGSICRIALNDPPLNILDIAMLTELRDALGSVSWDCSLLIISAAGEKAFSAGASVQDHLGDRIETMLSTFHDCFRMLDKLEAITVALARGVALGGGCELALACDLVLASDRAKFGQPEIKLGVFPPVAAYQLSRQLSPRKGLELLLTGDSIDAATAAALGIVNAVFPFDEFDSASEEWLTRLQRQSPSSLRHAKKAFRLGREDDFDSRLARIERLYLDDLMTTADATEGLNAFLQKRKPEWKT